MYYFNLFSVTFEVRFERRNFTKIFQNVQCHYLHQTNIYHSERLETSLILILRLDHIRLTLREISRVSWGTLTPPPHFNLTDTLSHVIIKRRKKLSPHIQKRGKSTKKDSPNKKPRFVNPHAEKKGTNLSFFFFHSTPAKRPKVPLWENSLFG